MKVKGYFPLPFVTGDSGWPPSYKRGHPSHKMIGSLSGKEVTQELMAQVNAAIATSSNQYVTGFPPDWHYGPYGVVTSGTPVPTPPDKFFDLEPVGVTTPNFRKRVREGDIVVSDYKRGQIWSKYALGFTHASPPKPGEDRFHSDSFCRLFEVESDGWIRNGGIDINANGHYVKSEYRNIDLSVSPYDVGWNDNIFDQMLRKHVRGPSSDCTAMITKVTSDANRMIVDALTSAAEMPETIKSILQGCKSIIRLYTDTKNKELRLYNKIKRISAESKSSHNQRQMAKVIKDLNDAIADVWLNFRYNIMPNVYLIEDLIKATESVGKNFFRFRDGDTFKNSFSPEITLPQGWTGSMEYESLGRVFIKRSVAANSTDWRHLVSFNMFVTAWELVPLSFVIDWVVNIGNTLSALLSPNLNYEEGATFSWKTDHTFTFTHGQTNAQVTARMSCYDRLVISPSDYCRLTLSPDFNVLRQLDALALSWKILTSKLIR